MKKKLIFLFVLILISGVFSATLIKSAPLGIVPNNKFPSNTHAVLRMDDSNLFVVFTSASDYNTQVFTSSNNGSAWTNDFNFTIAGQIISITPQSATDENLIVVSYDNGRQTGTTIRYCFWRTRNCKAEVDWNSVSLQISGAGQTHAILDINSGGSVWVLLNNGTDYRPFSCSPHTTACDTNTNWAQEAVIDSNSGSTTPVNFFFDSNRNPQNHAFVSWLDSPNLYLAKYDAASSKTSWNIQKVKTATGITPSLNEAKMIKANADANIVFVYTTTDTGIIPTSYTMAYDRYAIDTNTFAGNKLTPIVTVDDTLKSLTIDDTNKITIGFDDATVYSPASSAKLTHHTLSSNETKNTLLTTVSGVGTNDAFIAGFQQKNFLSKNFIDVIYLLDDNAVWYTQIIKPKDIDFNIDYPNAELINFNKSNAIIYDINFFVKAEDANSILIDLNYNTSATQGTGAVILNDVNTTGSVITCEDSDFTNYTKCSYDWNIAGVPNTIASGGVSMGAGYSYYILGLAANGSSALADINFDSSDNFFDISGTVNFSVAISNPSDGSSTLSNDINIQWSSATGGAAAGHDANRYYIRINGGSPIAVGSATTYAYSLSGGTVLPFTADINVIAESDNLDLNVYDVVSVTFAGTGGGTIPLTCSELGGSVCGAETACAGAITTATDTSNCCLGSCSVIKSLEELEGTRPERKEEEKEITEKAEYNYSVSFIPSIFLNDFQEIKVFDSGLLPVQNAFIKVDRLVSGFTDEKGTFKFKSFKEGRFNFSVSVDSRHIFSGSFKSKGIKIIFDSEIILINSVVGMTVVDSIDFLPISGIKVTVLFPSGDIQEFITNKDGRVEFFASEVGKYTVSALKFQANTFRNINVIEANLFSIFSFVLGNFVLFLSNKKIFPVLSMLLIFLSVLSGLLAFRSLQMYFIRLYEGAISSSDERKILFMIVVFSLLVFLLPGIVSFLLSFGAGILLSIAELIVLSLLFLRERRKARKLDFNFLY